MLSPDRQSCLSCCWRRPRRGRRRRRRHRRGRRRSRWEGWGWGRSLYICPYRPVRRRGRGRREREEGGKKPGRLGQVLARPLRRSDARALALHLLHVQVQQREQHRERARAGSVLYYRKDAARNCQTKDFAPNHQSLRNALPGRKKTRAPLPVVVHDEIVTFS